MTILFCGGGTLGPVTPLIAVLRRMKILDKELEFIWAGTPDGPERQIIEKEGLNFFEIPALKIPRYVSTNWIVWPFNFLKARSAAKKLINEERPDLVVSAGGFTGVPVIKMAKRKKIPCAIHQLDVLPGLANKLVARLCDLVTTSFRYEESPFFGITSERVPTPNRFSGVDVPSRTRAVNYFGLDETRPVIFIVGGGTGARSLNEAVWSILDQLLKKTQIIHMTGKGKGQIIPPQKKEVTSLAYVQKEFLTETEILNAYAAADLVISRAGIGGISDLSALSKPAIFVPIPDSQQEKNIENLLVEVVDQRKNFASNLYQKIATELEDDDCRINCGKRLHREFPTDDGTTLAKKWLELLPKK